jgi:L-aspartate oxidase
MAEFAARRAVQFRKDIDFPQEVQADYPAEAPADPNQEKILFSHHRRDLQRVMSDFVGIVRTEERLKIALGKARRIKYTVDEEYAVRSATYNLAELRNMVMLAELVIESAILRPESRGLHYLEGIPKSYDAFKRDTIIPGQFDTETDDADYARHDSHT